MKLGQWVMLAGVIMIGLASVIGTLQPILPVSLIAFGTVCLFYGLSSATGLSKAAV